MEIIKHGKTYKSHICKHCGCVFNYCENDIEPEYQMSGIFGNNIKVLHTYIRCPECGYKHNLDND